MYGIYLPSLYYLLYVRLKRIMERIAHAIQIKNAMTILRSYSLMRLKVGVLFEYDCASSTSMMRKNSTDAIKNGFKNSGPAIVIYTKKAARTAIGAFTMISRINRIVLHLFGIIYLLSSCFAGL